MGNSAFDNITEKAREMVNAISKKTDDIVSISKLKMRISTLNSDIKAAYARLGSAVYDGKRSGLSNDELIQLIVSEIDQLQSELQEITKEVDVAANINRCKSCGYENAVTANFCAKCGSPLEKPQYPGDGFSSTASTVDPDLPVDESVSYHSDSSADTVASAPLSDDSNSDLQ